MKIAKRMDLLGSETAFAVSAEATSLASKGTKIYPFHLGDINLPTPKSVVEAAKEIKLDKPLVVRLEGTNVEEGKKILQKSDLDIIAASNLEEAAEKIVKVVEGS